ncbi:MAG: class I SAM-dependent methyltransferase [Aulosira sp. ZfuVER01]|nr:class I SAM-dependent methyltransferase [Aulosira sp. ZfuVER01]MDZ8000771.1 class I SAM-dependent methyltransferase [Aulosira sp. DedVER01a]MDZ8055080.1 class I SAM-dependent methyltransferase [Aulosira sp. ZfuCHP01]
MQIKSPLTNSLNVVLEQEIEVNSIVKGYQDWLQIDVSRYFGELKHIQIYRCNDTGYRFYYPSNLEGDEELYIKLQNFPWYYVDWKWEYEIVSKAILSKDPVLEIGCGRGVFIDKMQQTGAICRGLELNESAAKRGREKGLDIFMETIEKHAKNNFGKYDVVISFQVLEHVFNVREFLQSSIEVLKPEGKLIICVPNNDSFVKYAKGWVTNMPPHHMGLWNEESLKSIQNLFPVKVTKVYFEPLSTYDWYYHVHSEIILSFLDNRNKILGRIVRRLSRIIRDPSIALLKIFSKLIHSHSIIVEFTKL